jgi:hypothetical protein
MTMSEPRAPELPPDGLGEAGASFWSKLVATVEFDPHELQLLEDTCAVVDTIHALETRIRRDGPLTDDGRPHPATTEARLQRNLLVKMIASLRVPESVGDEVVTPQRRGGARGPYRTGRGR